MVLPPPRPALNETLGTEVPDPMVDMFTGDITDEVLPYARGHGVTEEQIVTMLTANPRRIFETTG
jgi:predicted metal-dependent phosphotriesterase family hydrolase